MIQIIDSTAACMPLRPYLLRPGNVSVVGVHRLSFSEKSEDNPDPIPDDQLNGVAVAKKFKAKALGTGGVTPYHVLLRTDGVWEQMLPLIVQGSHARNYNWCSLGIAVVGRYHEREMKGSTWVSLVELLSKLSVLPQKIMGHTELDKDKSPNCPGKYVNMDWLRNAVAAAMPTSCNLWDTRQRLEYIAQVGFSL